MYVIYMFNSVEINIYSFFHSLNLITVRESPATMDIAPIVSFVIIVIQLRIGIDSETLELHTNPFYWHLTDIARELNQKMSWDQTSSVLRIGATMSGKWMQIPPRTCNESQH